MYLELHALPTYLHKYYIIEHNLESSPIIFTLRDERINVGTDPLFRMNSLGHWYIKFLWEQCPATRGGKDLPTIHWAVI